MLVQSTVVVAILTGLVSAVTNANSTIDPNSVALTLRSQWCQAEINTCGTLCSGESTTNTCDENTLNYTCTCSANNSAPGLAFYKNTMPYFICEQIFTNCIKAGENDAAAQAVCNRNEKANCGQIDPANFTAAVTTTSSASNTATGTAAPASSGTGASTSSSKAAAATLAIAQRYGTGALVAGAAAAFGMML